MRYFSISRPCAAILAVLLAAPLGVAAQQAQVLQATDAKSVKAAQIAQSGRQKAIGSVAAPGDQIVLSTRTYCFDANDNRVKCPDKITIRTD